MVLCIVALAVFSVMSIWSAKYRRWAREALRCVIKNLTLSPCDVGLEQRIKGKVTAKLLVVPALARFFYRNFGILSWAFTISFFASLIYTGYSFYNFFVYGSCEPGGSCYLTPFIGWCILVIEQMMIYVVLVVLAAIAAYFVIKRVRRKN